jgi:nucleotide-binding universal stress UspA family protein
MKTFLVPVDFSDTSKNAAQYAAQLTNDIADAKIILYNVYDKITFSTSRESEQNTRRGIAESELNELKASLPVANGVTVSTVAEEGSLVSNIEKFVGSNSVDIIVMGITGSSRIKQVFMGTNTLNVMRHLQTPLMIIPPDAKFSGLRNVMFTSDFKDVANTTPFTSLKAILDLFNPLLHIVNVDAEHYVELTEEYKRERAVFADQLRSYTPEFYFLRTYDFMDGIDLFVETKNIDAIITVPKKHNFLSQLFVQTHTKKLAYHSHLPIIAIHV